MKYRIELTPNFKREFKKLAKKYISIIEDFKQFTEILTSTPNSGTSLGSGIYKIRMKVTSKGKGKSGGARIIYFYKSEKENIILLSIYDKSENDNISEDKIKNLIQLYLK